MFNYCKKQNANTKHYITPVREKDGEDIRYECPGYKISITRGLISTFINPPAFLTESHLTPAVGVSDQRDKCHLNRLRFAANLHYTLLGVRFEDKPHL